MFNKKDLAHAVQEETVAREIIKINKGQSEALIDVVIEKVQEMAIAQGIKLHGLLAIEKVDKKATIAHNPQILADAKAEGLSLAEAKERARVEVPAKKDLKVKLSANLRKQANA